MVTTTIRDGRDRSAVKDAIAMEVEHTLNIEETKLKITPKNPVISVGVVDDGTFQKKAVAIDKESGRNVITKEDISRSEIKAANMATIVWGLESRGREDGTGKNNAKVGSNVVDLGPIEKVTLGSDIK